MHPNPIFHDAEQAENTAFARERGFGVLAVTAAAAPDEPPLMSHVPFLLSSDGGIADLHLVRSNPIARALSSPKAARLAVSGPDGYVSPDWYGIPDQVPTWNYTAVHLTGVLELRPQEELRELLDRQSAFFEAKLAPKPAWSTGKMDAAALDRMMRMIVPVRMRITAIAGTRKLSQNKSEEARLGAAAGITSGSGSELAELARLMQVWPANR